MRMHQRGVLVVIATLLSGLLPGCGGSNDGPELPGLSLMSSTRELTSTATLQPFNDAWPSATPRFLDVGDVEFLHATSPATIDVKYDPAPGVPYFVGAIRASGLKPNFCYQLKLVGKPGVATSSRAKPDGVGKPPPPDPEPVDPGLWGNDADNSTNLALLQAGRWWNYKTEQPAFDTSNEAAILSSSDYLGGWVAGYIYFGFVMTDSAGNAAWSVAVDPTADFATLAVTGVGADGYVPIAANGSFHITAKDNQTISRQTTIVEHTSLRPSAAYGSDLPSSVTPLWLQKEPNDPIPVALPNGTHDVVLMLTEESFHQSGLGGYWETVFVNDWSTRNSPVSGAPWVTGVSSPIVFQTGPPSQPMTAMTAVRWRFDGRKWYPEATVTVTGSGGQVAGATVQGVWSRAYSGTVSGVTSAAGTVVIAGPAKYRTPALVAFDTTVVTAEGYDLDITNSTLHAEASQ